MFTGLVEEIGTVRNITKKGNYQLLSIQAEKVLEDLKLGDSISVNGVCQTVTEIDYKGFAVETLSVSLQKTSLGQLKKNNRVNLERALTATSRLGGHIVQGHVDNVGRISAIRRHSENIYLEVILPQQLIQYCVREGSIAIEGISLTIAEIRGVRIITNIIPATWNHTILKNRSTGDQINIEVDIMARYVENMLQKQNPHSQQGGKNE